MQNMFDRPALVRMALSVSMPGVLLVASPAWAGPVDVEELTAQQIQADLATGTYTIPELTQSYLDRIDKFDGFYNSFISVNPDALSRAQALQAEFEATGSRGPLFGVPVAIKDNIDVVGIVTTAGSSLFSSAAGGVDNNPRDSALVIQKLEDAGAIVIGKTNLPDFAFSGSRTESSVSGVTLNPYNIDKVPGGSSGGTATAVNASFAALGLGTETGGSIENPASAQALVGVKPTLGLVPLDGVVPIDAVFRDVVGPLARNVTDAANTLDIIAGTGPGDSAVIVTPPVIPAAGYAAGLSTTSLEGKRFGAVGTGFRDLFLPLAPETDAFYQQAISAIEAEGATVIDDPFEGTGFKEIYASRSGVPGLGGIGLEGYLASKPDSAGFGSVAEYEAITGEPFPVGFFTNPPDDFENTPGYLAYLDFRDELLAVFQQVLEDNDLDGLFFPQAGAPIPNLVLNPGDPFFDPDDADPNEFPELPSNIINDLGVPVVTLPFGYYDEGTPFTLAFIGDLNSDAELLSYAFDLEQATLARVAPTLMVPTPTAVLAAIPLLGVVLIRRRGRERA